VAYPQNLLDALEHLLERYRKVIAEVAQQFKNTLGVPVYRPSHKQSEHAKVALEVRRERILRARALFVECQNVARVLALEFQRLVFEKDVQALSAWFMAMKSSGLPDLVSFATYLDRERKPLEAAISEVWANGRTEGHVNRLKLIKRQGYGQAGFELLRKRVLLA
jgi:transposase